MNTTTPDSARKPLDCDAKTKLTTILPCTHHLKHVTIFIFALLLHYRSLKTFKKEQGFEKYNTALGHKTAAKADF
jgi:hypothetical protein